jgi:hypothetical protein
VITVKATWDKTALSNTKRLWAAGARFARGANIEHPTIRRAAHGVARSAGRAAGHAKNVASGAVGVARDSIRTGSAAVNHVVQKKPLAAAAGLGGLYALDKHLSYRAGKKDGAKEKTAETEMSPVAKIAFAQGMKIAKNRLGKAIHMAEKVKPGENTYTAARNVARLKNIQDATKPAVGAIGGRFADAASTIKSRPKLKPAVMSLMRDKRI